MALLSSLSGSISDAPTDSHPPSNLRVAIQEASSANDLKAFQPTNIFESGDTHALQVLVGVGFDLRSAIHLQLADEIGMTSRVIRSVADSTAAALEGGLLPSSHEWPKPLQAEVSSVESGLIQGLWTRRGNTSSTASSDLPFVLDEDRVGRAIDALEFRSRYDLVLESLALPSDEAPPVPNILWITSRGVKTAPDVESGAPGHRSPAWQIFPSLPTKRNHEPECVRTDL